MPLKAAKAGMYIGREHRTSKISEMLDAIDIWKGRSNQKTH
jgi:hypothetical protein